MARGFLRLARRRGCSALPLGCAVVLLALVTPVAASAEVAPPPSAPPPASHPNGSASATTTFVPLASATNTVLYGGKRGTSLMLPVVTGTSSE